MYYDFDDDIEILSEGAATDSKVLISTLYKITETNLSKPAIKNELFKGVQKYIDRNSDIVNSPYMTNRIFFTDSDKKYIINASGQDIDKIKDVLKNSEYIKDTWKTLNDPLNICAVMIIRYFTLTKKEAELKTFLTYFSLYFYTLLYHKYLPYGAQENIMEYTINNLSNKFLIKQTGSLLLTIQHTAMISHECHVKSIKEGTDKGLADYISSLMSRLNNFVKNIKNEYTINHQNKNYMNYDSDSYDEDNFHLADNSSYDIQNCADSAISKLTTYGADMKLVKLAANMNTVSENEIRNVINAISDHNIDEARRLFSLILQLYLFKDGNRVQDIHSKKFLYECIEIYKKSNTNDKVILEIKDILDKWLKTYSLRYNKTNREATLSSFRRAIYMYFVLHMQQSR